MQNSLGQISPEEIIALVHERRHRESMIKAIIHAPSVETDKSDDKELMNLILNKLNSDGEA